MKKIESELYESAEKFRRDFERAQLTGNFAKLDFLKTRAGPQEMTDGVAAAKLRVRKALEAMGSCTSHSQSCLWNVVGLGANLEAWTHLIRKDGASMNADRASGVLQGCLDRLAIHYGVLDPGKLGAIGQDRAYGRGIKSAIDFITVFATKAQGAERPILAKLIADMEKRFSRFA